MSEVSLKQKTAQFEQLAREQAPRTAPPEKIAVDPVVRQERLAWAAQRWGKAQTDSPAPVSTAPEIINRMNSPSAIKAERERLVTEKRLRELEERWRKTVEYAIKMAPDERIRILSTIPGEVSETLRSRAGGLREAARAQLAEGVGERIAASRSLAEPYTSEWGANLASAPLPDKALAAGALLHAIGAIEEQAALDQAAMRRVGDTQFDATLAALGERAKAMKALYKGLQPKRTMQGETPVTPVETASSGKPPPLGTLGGQDKQEFDDLLGRIGAGMAADPSKPPALDDIETEVAAIGNALAGDQQHPLDPAAELADAKFNWETVKGRFKAIAKGGPGKAADPASAKTYMERMWWHRRQIVDAQMLALQRKYGFDWASVGSANLESDYDISVKTHGTQGATPQGAIVEDWKIVKEFNGSIALGHGNCQPGTIFDTNLYASAPVTKADGETPTPRDSSMAAMTEQGQDVGALMKMRRYMDWEEYDGFQKGVLAELVTPQKEETLRQFEEADDLFFMSVRQQLVRAKMVPAIDNASVVTPDAQKALLEQLKTLEHNPDKMMAVNNELYVEAMTEVRKIEAALKLLDEGSEEYDAALAKLKTSQADAVFFAAEAYHSDGPFKHIVWADQAAKGKVENDPATALALAQIGDAQAKKDKLAELIAAEKKTRLASVSDTEMLQSFNENLGDMLKDFGHYEEKSPFPGLGFYRASKYLARLCDTMLVMASKTRGAGNEALAVKLEAIGFDGASAEAVKGMALILAKVRGGAVEFKDVPDAAAEAEAYATALVQALIPSATSLRDLGAVVKKTGQEVNTLMRKEIAAAKMRAASDQGYFQAPGTR